MTYCGYGDLTRLLVGAQLGDLSAPHNEERPGFALPGDRPHFAPDRPADVRHVHLGITLDFERKAVTGSVTTTFAALFEQVREVAFAAAELDIQRVALAGAKQTLEHWSEGEQLHVLARGERPLLVEPPPRVLGLFERRTATATDAED